jgi:hypothetical protein
MNSPIKTFAGVLILISGAATWREPQLIAPGPRFTPGAAVRFKLALRAGHGLRCLCYWRTSCPWGDWVRRLPGVVFIIWGAGSLAQNKLATAGDPNACSEDHSGSRT